MMDLFLRKNEELQERVESKNWKLRLFISNINFKLVLFMSALPVPTSNLPTYQKKDRSKINAQMLHFKATALRRSKIALVEALIAYSLGEHVSQLRHRAALRGTGITHQVTTIPTVVLVPELLGLAGEGGVPGEVAVAAVARVRVVVALPGGGGAGGAVDPLAGKDHAAGVDHALIERVDRRVKVLDCALLT